MNRIVKTAAATIIGGFALLSLGACKAEIGGLERSRLRVVTCRRPEVRRHRARQLNAGSHRTRRIRHGGRHRPVRHGGRHRPVRQHRHHRHQPAEHRSRLRWGYRYQDGGRKRHWHNMSGAERAAQVLTGSALPPGYGNVNPFVAVRGPGGASAFIDFLEHVFDARETLAAHTVDADDLLIHAEARVGGSTIMMCDAKPHWRSFRPCSRCTCEASAP